MTTGLARAVSLATALALTLTLVAIAPAAAGPTVTRVIAAEKYALSLLNCTRTGGWVTKSGACVGRGTGHFSAFRKPLRLHKNISTKVAWPWARTMVQYDVCDHAMPSKPVLSVRLRSAGFRYHTYGENVGCGWGYSQAKDLVLASHRAMQAEKASKGGHWKNMKNPLYKSVGIGVATGQSRTMIVYDFYGKLYR